MVHLVKKRINGNNYLYLQKSIYINNKKRKTIHVAYLGKEDKYTKSELKNIIQEYNREVGKNENRRTKR